jgi:hypothetical protein
MNTAKTANYFRLNKKIIDTVKANKKNSLKNLKLIPKFFDFLLLNFEEISFYDEEIEKMKPFTGFSIMFKLVPQLHKLSINNRKMAIGTIFLFRELILRKFND